jgi:hypothetical protein
VTSVNELKFNTDVQYTCSIHLFNAVLSGMPNAYTKPNGADTARAAYARIYSALPQCRSEILNVLKAVEDDADPYLTANEIMPRVVTNPDLDNASTRTRLNELRSMKLAVSDKTKPDPVSGNRVLAWRALRFNETTPIRLKKLPGKKAIAAAFVAGIMKFLEAHPEHEEELVACIPEL